MLWKHLRDLGVGEDFLDSVRTPMGVYLGGRTHEEIAVSVVAELIAVRRLGHDLKDSWAERDRDPARNEGVRDLPGA